jgi:hypothetical protein
MVAALKTLARWLKHRVLAECVDKDYPVSE